MKTLYFVRHGQSTANAGGITQDNAVIELSSLGQQQARAVLAFLPPTPAAVYTSTFLRTQQTAAPYCQAVQCTAKAHPSFHELTNIDPALLQGMTGDERWPLTKAYWDTADPQHRAGINAETFAEFDARVAVFMHDLPHFAHDTVLFGHGLFFSLLLWKHLGFTVDTSQGMAAFRSFQLNLPMPNCAVYRLYVDDTRLWQIQAVLPSIVRPALL
jgi:broad specificity phosphatase PhoE